MMVSSTVILDASDDGGRPFDDERLEPVFLIEIGVHVLLHRLSRLLHFLLLLVVLHLLPVDVHYHVVQLLQGKIPDLGRPDLNVQVGSFQVLLA